MLGRVREVAGGSCWAGLAAVLRSWPKRCDASGLHGGGPGAGTGGGLLFRASAPAHGALSISEEIKHEKGVWWMPWRREAMKDVAGCEKLRGVASRL